MELKEEHLQILEETDELLKRENVEADTIFNQFSKIADILELGIYQAPEIISLCSPKIEALYQQMYDTTKKDNNNLQESKKLNYIRMYLAFLRGDFKSYFTEAESYSIKYHEEFGGFDHDFSIGFLDLINNAPSMDDNVDRNKIIKEFGRIITKHDPESALAVYIKLLLKCDKVAIKTQERYCKQMIEYDPNWANAYAWLGDIFFVSKAWKSALNNYDLAAQKSDYLKTDLLYFKAAYAAGELKDYAREEALYLKCLEITPSFQHANNNLGYCLIKQRRYDEAMIWLDKSVELDEDGFRSYRNKFDVLVKIGRKEEAVILAKEYPQHFQTKYYCSKISEYSEDSTDAESLLQQLQQTTENEFAGSMKVSDVKSNIELYPHQQEAMRQMDAKILHSDSFAGLLVLPTGGGKTLTATYWLMHNMLDKGKKILWIAHRHELLNQAEKSFEKVCYKDISQNELSYKWRILSGQHDKPVNIKSTDDIIIASKTSLKRGLEYFLKNWFQENHDNIFVIIDEAHHAVASEYRELIKTIQTQTKHFKLLGLTATPFRTAENEQGLLKKIFPDDIVYKIDLRELISRGILSEPIFRPISTNVDMINLFQEQNAEDVLERISKDKFFDIDSIGKTVAKTIAENSKRNHAIVDEYIKNRSMYGQTLVFALNVDMAIVLNALFKEKGVRSDFVVSDVKDSITGVQISSEQNIEKIKSFRAGNLEVLINVNILTEGTDLPSVQSVFLTRPTKSTILMTQMIGRALRGERAGGTRNAYIVSFIDDWQNRIAWINPEQLFIDENVDFTKNDRETQKMVMRLVSIAKLEEFARLANGTADESLENINFIDRIPIGIYKFSYNLQEDEESIRNCNILVYDCMIEAYRSFQEWLQKTEITDVDAAVIYADEMMYGTQPQILGYDQQDLRDMICYYHQTQILPEMILLTERQEYDISKIARHITDDQLSPNEKKSYIESEWNRSDLHWSAFFGIENNRAFRKQIDIELDKLDYPEEYETPLISPITQKETFQIQNLTLRDIRKKYPVLGEKLREIIFTKYTDVDGYYYSAESGFRSKNRLDFQIDHIKPMAKGGLTIPSNLQLLTRKENILKSDSQ